MNLVLCAGVELRRSNAGTRGGLALCIKPEAQQTGQLQRLLQRRFEQAVAFDGCFVFVEPDGTLVIWQELTAAGAALGEVSRRLLSLAEFNELDSEGSDALALF